MLHSYTVIPILLKTQFELYKYCQKLLKVQRNNKQLHGVEPSDNQKIPCTGTAVFITMFSRAHHL